MKDQYNFQEQLNEIIKGLAISTEAMIKFKKSKNSPIVISKNGKVVLVNPHEFETFNDQTNTK